MQLSLVIPLRDEIDSVDALLEALDRTVPLMGMSYEYILIDDGSVDGTFERLQTLAAGHPEIRILKLRRSYGQTSALHAGIQEALGTVIVTLDGDLQNDPADIPKLVARLDDGFDLVCGWRKIRHDSLVTRRLPSRVANALIRMLTHTTVHDIGCTLRAMQGDIAKELPLRGQWHRFIPVLAAWKGARVTEMVVTHHPRVAGLSKYRLSRSLGVLVDLAAILYLTRWSDRPMRFSVSSDSGCALISCGCLLSSVPLFSMGSFATAVAAVFVSIIGGFTSLLLASFGFLAEQMATAENNSPHGRPWKIRARFSGTLDEIDDLHPDIIRHEYFGFKDSHHAA